MIKPETQVALNSYEMFQMTEVSRIAGVLEGQGRIAFNEDYSDIDVMYDSVYYPIFEQWANAITENNTGIFKDSEEEGYIGAYAERKLIELYGLVK